MSRLQKMKEKQQKLSRFQALKSIFTSLFMTVTIVVVATVVIPTSPKASIESLEAFNHTIIYHIQVTDSDNAIKEDSLKVVLINQFEEYELRLEIGNNTGFFTELNSETEYKIKVMADKGYGYEVLDSETINTEPNTGGAISYVDIISESEWGYDYQLDYFISDPFDEYQSIQFRYGYLYPWEEEPFEYYTVPLSFNESTLILPEVTKENVTVFLYLEAITSSSETVILDEMTFKTPYNLYAFVYAERIEDEGLSFSVYAENPDSEMEIEYELQLLLHDYVVASESFVIEIDEEHMHHDATIISFDDLIPDTTYTVVLLAKYDDPYTLAYTEKSLYTSEVTTLMDVEYEIEIIEYETYYEVTMMVDDPENQLTQAYYYVYTESEFGLSILNSSTIMLETQGDLLGITFTIDKLSEAVTFEIGIRSEVNFTHYIIFELFSIQEEES